METSVCMYVYIYIYIHIVSPLSWMNPCPLFFEEIPFSHGSLYEWLKHFVWTVAWLVISHRNRKQTYACPSYARKKYLWIWSVYPYFVVVFIPCHWWYIYIYTGWWFGCHQFYFPRNIGFLVIPIDFHIFQRASNHQPVYIYIYPIISTAVSYHCYLVTWSPGFWTNRPTSSPKKRLRQGCSSLFRLFQFVVVQFGASFLDIPYYNSIIIQHHTFSKKKSSWEPGGATYFTVWFPSSTSRWTIPSQGTALRGAAVGCPQLAWDLEVTYGGVP